VRRGPCWSIDDLRDDLENPATRHFGQRLEACVREALAPDLAPGPVRSAVAAAEIHPHPGPSHGEVHS
jgi:hypothetical protein